MNSGNSKTSGPHGLLLNLSDERNINKSDKCVALPNQNMEKSNKNYRFKISASKWNDGSFSVSDIQN